MTWDDGSNVSDNDGDVILEPTDNVSVFCRSDGRESCELWATNWGESDFQAVSSPDFRRSATTQRLSHKGHLQVHRTSVTDLCWKLFEIRIVLDREASAIICQPSRRNPPAAPFGFAAPYGGTSMRRSSSGRP